MGIYTNKIFKMTESFFIFWLFVLVSTTSMAAPVILYTDITSGPNTGGEDNKGCYLSIFGKNFGDDINNVIVTINDTEVGAYKFLGASLGRPDIQQLSVQVGTGTANNTQTGPIKVTVNGESSNTDHVFSVRNGDLYFISHSGNNSTGEPNNFNNTFRTGQAVYDRDDFGPGDFIIIKNDEIYDFSSGDEGLSISGLWIILRKTGLPDNPITIYGYPGSTPTTFKLSASSQGVINESSYPQVAGDHHTFANFKCDHNHIYSTSTLWLGNWYEPNVTASYSRVVNIWAANGLRVQNSSVGRSPFNFQRIENSKVFGCQLGPQAEGNTGNNEGHVIYQSHAYTNVESGWLYIHDFPYIRGAYQIAGDHWGSSADECWGDNTNVRIHDCYFKNLNREAILCNLGSFGVNIYRNIFDNVGYSDSGFSPIALRGAKENEGIYELTNNFIYTDALNGGIIQMGYSPSVTYPERVILKNNIIVAKSSSTNYYQINHSSFSTSQIEADYNIWYGSSQGMPSWAGPNSISSDPLFINADNSNFALQSDSPAFDLGIMDIGSIEFAFGRISIPNNFRILDYN